MSKEIITVRVEPRVKDLISQLALADDRTVSYMAERLIIEALQAKGCLTGASISKEEKRRRR